MLVSYTTKPDWFFYDLFWIENLAKAKEKMKFGNKYKLVLSLPM